MSFFSVCACSFVVHSMLKGLRQTKLEVESKFYNDWSSLYNELKVFIATNGAFSRHLSPYNGTLDNRCTLEVLVGDTTTIRQVFLVKAG